MKEQCISLSDLRKVSGIGDKTIERIKAQLLQNELDGNYISEYDTNIKLDVNEIYQGDCLELMNGIPDKSVDMILCDLPYGTTSCSWDEVIPFDKLWKQYKRIIKDNGAIVLTASQPFTSAMITSNIEWFRYNWVWQKTKAQGFLNAKKMPMKIHEDICVFSKKPSIYNPQGLIYGEFDNFRPSKLNKGDDVYGKEKHFEKSTVRNYPKTVISFSNPSNEGHLHPTQKPVELFEYLINTYTNEGDLVLDNCIGSGTTAISAINTNRSYIGIELDENYYNIAKNRINEHKSNKLINSLFYRDL